MPDRETPLSRWLQELEGFSELDALDDPFLEQALLRLGPGQRDVRFFWHARANLLHCQAIPLSKPRPLDDWRPALERMLRADPPAAQLLLPRSEGNLIPLDLAERAFAHEEPSLLLVPALSGVLVDRSTPLVLASFPWTQTVDSTTRHQRTWLDVSADGARDEARWRRLADLSPSCGSGLSSREIRQALDDGPPGQARGFGRPGADLSLPLSALDQEWIFADHQLATLWVGLARALRAGEGVRLHDGASLLPLDGGLLARVVMHRHAARPSLAAVRGGFEGVCAPLSGRGLPSLRVATRFLELGGIRWGSPVTEGALGLQVPAAAWLWGGGYAAHVTLSSSPLSSGGLARLTAGEPPPRSRSTI